MNYFDRNTTLPTEPIPWSEILEMFLIHSVFRLENSPESLKDFVETVSEMLDPSLPIWSAHPDNELLRKDLAVLPEKLREFRYTSPYSLRKAYENILARLAGLFVGAGVVSNGLVSMAEGHVHSLFNPQPKVGPLPYLSMYSSATKCYFFEDGDVLIFRDFDVPNEETLRFLSGGHVVASYLPMSTPLSLTPGLGPGEVCLGLDQQDESWIIKAKPTVFQRKVWDKFQDKKAKENQAIKDRKVESARRSLRVTVEVLGGKDKVLAELSKL